MGHNPGLQEHPCDADNDLLVLASAYDKPARFPAILIDAPAPKRLRHSGESIDRAEGGISRMRPAPRARAKLLDDQSEQASGNNHRSRHASRHSASDQKYEPYRVTNMNISGHT
jgi:hypothetical protein